MLYSIWIWLLPLIFVVDVAVKISHGIDGGDLVDLLFLGTNIVILILKIVRNWRQVSL